MSREEGEPLHVLTARLDDHALEVGLVAAHRGDLAAVELRLNAVRGRRAVDAPAPRHESHVRGGKARSRCSLAARAQAARRSDRRASRGA